MLQDDLTSSADDNQSADLAAMLADCVRAGWRITLLPKSNDWATPEATLTFVRVGVQARTLRQQTDDLAEGIAPSAPLHYSIDLLSPDSITKAVARHYSRFVRPQRG